MKYLPGKYAPGAIVLAAALTFAGGIAPTPVAAANADSAHGVEAIHAASTTDISARRRHLRRYRYVRPHVYPYAAPYSYGYYRPRPYYYRPYYGPGAFFGFPFGPRYYW